MKLSILKILSAITLSALIISTLFAFYGASREKPITWDPHEIALVKSLMIEDTVIALPSHGNDWADEEAAAQLGQKLFFDKRLSSDGETSCATCHQPSQFFSDNEKVPTSSLAHQQNNGQSSNKIHRNTPTIVGAALSQWQFWDGRADSLWSQALEPFENADEFGGNRLEIVRMISKYYQKEYQAIFGQWEAIPFNQLPSKASPRSDDNQIKQNWASITKEDQLKINRVFANLGKAIEAYERKLLPKPSRFDEFARSLKDNHPNTDNHILTKEEQLGLQLFISEDGGRCVRCHNGSNFSNADFHSIAVPTHSKYAEDIGRQASVKLIDTNEFGCTSSFSDAQAEQGHCDEVIYAKRSGYELKGAFKVPSLRNISKTAPYMHRGQIQTLAQVLHYYNRAPAEPHVHTDIEPLRLLPRELSLIEAFLLTLDSDINADPKWLKNPNS